jgi:CRISPR/Cas system-associated exonuclease Cas4 (RecB family)
MIPLATFGNMFQLMLTHMTSDERENKMSGSGMAGYAACAGKFQLEQTCPRDEGNEYTEMGNRIHLYLAGVTDITTLNEEERNIADRCLHQYGEIIAQLPAEIGHLMESALENRLWYNDTWSGQIDRIDWFGDFRETALVVDWKTGRTPQGNAAENLQLRAYAVLVKKNYPSLKRIFVAIVQPLAAPYTIAEYEEIDLTLADEQIQSIVDAALAPNAPRTPSPDACKYCRAKSICPEVGGEALALAAVASAPIPVYTNVQIADFLEKATIVESFIEALRSEAKKRLQEGHEIAGYKLSAGRTSRSIEDPVLAYRRTGINSERFISACKISIPTLEKVFAADLDIKPKEAKAMMEEMLGDALVSKTGEPIMTRVK